MTQEGNATFQEVFSMASLTDLIKLLPWCVSSTAPFYYLGYALSTAVQQSKNIQSIATALRPKGSPVLYPSSSSDLPSGTPPPLLPLLPDIPFVGTPPVGCPFPGLITSPISKKWDHSSSDSLHNHHSKKTHISSPEVEVRSEHSSA